MRVQALVCIASKRAGRLVDAPVARAGDEAAPARRCVRPANSCSSAEVGRSVRSGTTAGRPGSRCGRTPRVDAPARPRAATCRRRSAAGDRHVRRHGLGHALVAAPSRSRSAASPARLGGPRRRAGAACWPSSRRSCVVVGAQEGVQALRAVPHVGVGLARRVVPLVVLARARQRGQVVVHVERRRPRRRGVGVSNGSAGGPANGALISTTERNTSGPHQRAPGRHRRAEVVADHRGDRAIARAPTAGRARRAPG